MQDVPDTVPMGLTADQGPSGWLRIMRHLVGLLIFAAVVPLIFHPFDRIRFLVILAAGLAAGVGVAILMALFLTGTGKKRIQTAFVAAMWAGATALWSSSWTEGGQPEWGGWLLIACVAMWIMAEVAEKSQKHAAYEWRRPAIVIGVWVTLMLIAVLIIIGDRGALSPADAVQRGFFGQAAGKSFSVDEVMTPQPTGNMAHPADQAPTAQAATGEGPWTQYQTPTADWSPAQKRDLEVVVADIVRRWPYLDTPAGASALKLIVAERDERIRRGADPAVALRDAAASIAPKHAPFTFEQATGR